MSALAPPLPVPAPPDPRPVRWTREEYYKLGELGFFRGKRVERIRGEIVEMSPVGWPHTLAKTLVADALRRAFAAGHWVNEQSPTAVEDSDPEADVAVYPGAARDYTDHPTRSVLAVEIAESSLTHDTTTKVELCAAAGHPEYWVLDLVHRQLLVFRDPMAIAAGGHTYRTRLTLGPADTVSPLVAPNASILVADLLP